MVLASGLGQTQQGGQGVEFERLAADARCLTAFLVPCQQALQLSSSDLSDTDLLWAELAEAMAPLGPTVTHLCMAHGNDSPYEPSAEARLLAKALPGVQHMYLTTMQPLLDTSEFVLHCPSLMCLMVHADIDPDYGWIRDMLMACVLASGTAHFHGPLRVNLPEIGPEDLQATNSCGQNYQQGWQPLPRWWQ